MPMVEPEESIRACSLNIAILRCHLRHGQDAGSSRGGWWLRYNPVARSMTSRFVNPADRRAEARGHSLRISRVVKSVAAAFKLRSIHGSAAFCFRLIMQELFRIGQKDKAPRHSR